MSMRFFSIVALKACKITHFFFLLKEKNFFINLSSLKKVKKENIFTIFRYIRPRLRKTQINLVFRSACTNFVKNNISL